jgi:hypothetical protein
LPWAFISQYHFGDYGVKKSGCASKLNIEGLKKMEAK